MSHGTIGRRSLLCVDHDAGMRALLSEAMNDHDVVVASNAYEALRNVNVRPFHGYVLDYWLPDWSGPALCREIRKADPHAPIVFCSSAAKETDRSRALRAGANAYMCKPVDPAELRAQLHSFLTRAEMESLRARVEEERAVQDELERRLADAQLRVEVANALKAASIERTARSRAFKAFIEARGSRAHFDTWWPQVFTSATANQHAGTPDV